MEVKTWLGDHIQSFNLHQLFFNFFFSTYTALLRHLAHPMARPILLRYLEYSLRKWTGLLMRVFSCVFHFSCNAMVCAIYNLFAPLQIKDHMPTFPLSPFNLMKFPLARRRRRRCKDHRKTPLSSRASSEVCV